MAAVRRHQHKQQDRCKREGEIEREGGCSCLRVEEGGEATGGAPGGLCQAPAMPQGRYGVVAEQGAHRGLEELSPLHRAQQRQAVNLTAVAFGRR